MSKTVLITGSSTGIGRATVYYFHQKGWKVIATMRSPEKEKEMHLLSGVIIAKLSVEDSESIRKSIQSGIENFGKIDVIVNNAGYALTGPFEDALEGQIRRQFETNVFGLMNVIREILPHFRKNNSGSIVNVASVAGRMTFPFYSLYHSSKWAVEGFSESLQYELEPLNIKVKIIEPGPIKTDFYTRSVDVSGKVNESFYATFFQRAMKNMQLFVNMGSSPKAVAKIIFKAAQSNSSKLRYPIGGGAQAMLFLRKIMPGRIFNKIVKKIVLK
jgi:NAD(P)-dependent dehydrogenase (short-subunit alcohol dehydrogenase family)